MLRRLSLNNINVYLMLLFLTPFYFLKLSIFHILLEKKKLQVKLKINFDIKSAFRKRCVLTLC